VCGIEGILSALDGSGAVFTLSSEADASCVETGTWARVEGQMAIRSAASATRGIGAVAKR